MILMPIVYVSDMSRSVAFYEALGFEVDVQSRTAGWTELRAGDRAVLALHLSEELSDPTGRVDLALVAEEPLELIAERHSDIVLRPPTDEAFGRSMSIRDPDGLEIWINEHDRTLYGASSPEVS